MPLQFLIPNLNPNPNPDPNPNPNPDPNPNPNPNPMTFFVGKNAQDNFDLIDQSNPEDIWFHVNDTSSAHVVYVSSHNNLDKKEKRHIIKKGAELAKQHSSAKSKKDVTIVYTQIKNVSKMETTGLVHILYPKYIVI